MKSTFFQNLLHTIYIRSWSWAHVPMIFRMRPRVETLTTEECVISIPLLRQNKNHYNSLYIGALVAGADIASGLLGLYIAKTKNIKAKVLFKSLNSEFFKRATGTTYFHCMDGTKIAQMLDQVQISKTRQNLPVLVRATCPDQSGDETIAKFIVTLSMK